MKILITAGGTQEKIDQVRSITNTSTGTTCLSIANALFQNNYQNIYYVHSQRAQSFPQAQKNFEFVSSDDLEKKLKDILSTNDIDVIIHGAAVSDFIVDKVVINGELYETDLLNKISSQDEVELILKRRSKIIEKLKGFSRKPHPMIIGFKLTNTTDSDEQKNQILKLSMSENVDFVVHNDLKNIDSSQHISKIYFKDQKLFDGTTKSELSHNILKILKNYTFNKEHFSDLMS